MDVLKLRLVLGLLAIQVLCPSFASADSVGKVSDVVIDAEDAEGGVDAAVEEEKIARSNLAADRKQHAKEKRDAEALLARARRQMDRAKEEQFKSEKESQELKAQMRQFNREAATAQVQYDRSSAKISAYQQKVQKLLADKNQAEALAKAAKEKTFAIQKREEQEKAKALEYQKQFLAALRQKESADREYERRQLRFAEVQRNRALQNKHLQTETARLAQQTIVTQRKTQSIVLPSTTVPSTMEPIARTRVTSVTSRSLSTGGTKQPAESLFTKIRKLW